MDYLKEKDKYLKSEQHYSDFYDKHTVEECRLIINRKHIPYEEALDKYGEEGAERMHKMLDEMFLHIRKGERYTNKKTAIDRWMVKDKARDEFYESVKASEDISCLTCGRLMFVTSKDLWTDLDKGAEYFLCMNAP